MFLFKIKITLLLIIFTTTAAYADLNIIKYTIKGVVKNEQGELITNDTLWVRDNTNNKKVAIDADGTFEVNLECHIPCFNSPVAVGGHKGAWVQMQTQIYNGEELFFWVPTLKIGQITKTKWQRHYAEMLKDAKDRQVLKPDSLELRLSEKFWLRPMQDKENWQCITTKKYRETIKKKDNKPKEYSSFSGGLLIELLRLVKVGSVPIDTALKWWNLCIEHVNIINEKKINIRVQKSYPSFYEKNYFFILDEQRRIIKMWSKIRRRRYD